VARKPGGRRVSEPVEAPGTPAEVAAGIEPAGPVEAASTWPGWARTAATVALAVHIAAVAGGALGVPPSSVLERRFADLFTWHHGLLDQGYAYRYYSEPPPTPVVLATLRPADGGDDVIVRLPGREVAGPPMRRQRQLALANALFASARTDHEGHDHGPGEGDHGPGWLARSYARHLCRTHPGTASVTLKVQQHLIPTPERVLDDREDFGGRFDLFHESLFTTPRWIGDFPCDGF